MPGCVAQLPTAKCYKAKGIAQQFNCSPLGTKLITGQDRVKGRGAQGDRTHLYAHNYRSHLPAILEQQNNLFLSLHLSRLYCQGAAHACSLMYRLHTGCISAALIGASMPLKTEQQRREAGLCLIQSFDMTHCDEHANPLGTPSTCDSLPALAFLQRGSEM